MLLFAIRFIGGDFLTYRLTGYVVDFRAVLHLDAVGKEPELAMADKIVVD